MVADSALHPLLSAGAQYWVTASASDLTDVAWNLNSTNDIGPHAQSQNGGPFNIVPGTRGEPTFVRYYAEMVPKLWLKSRNLQSRIFQRMTVPDLNLEGIG